MIPHIEDCAAHCAECNEMVACACAWSGCPFRNPRHEVGRRLPDADGLMALIDPFHSDEVA
jgi:hypothetical protein